MKKRVVVTQSILGICHMQVCAVKDATDEEILAVCNRENPSGTTAGWKSVRRAYPEVPEAEPVECEDDIDRLHILVSC